MGLSKRREVGFQAARKCLNVNWFLSLEDARGKIEAWRRHYNETRPHSALEDVPRRIRQQGRG
jgi:transposase InsO family protein